MSIFFQCISTILLLLLMRSFLDCIYIVYRKTVGFFPKLVIILMIYLISYIILKYFIFHLPFQVFTLLISFYYLINIEQNSQDTMKW